MTFERLRGYLNAKSDAEVARGLGVSPQALFIFKKQGKFPSDLLIKFCLKYQLSLDWLLTGEGEMRRGAEGAPIYKEGAVGVAEERATFTIDIKSAVAEHNRGIIEQWLEQIKRIIEEGDYRKTGAVGSLLEVLDPEGKKKE